jgi:hypothetical protein
MDRLLIEILRQHIEEFGVGADGRIFRSERGGIIASTAYSEVWQEARTLAFSPAQVERVDNGQRRAWPVYLGNRHGAVEVDNWGVGQLAQPAIERDDGRPVDLRLGLQSGDRGLYCVRAAGA